MRQNVLKVMQDEPAAPLIETAQQVRGNTLVVNPCRSCAAPFAIARTLTDAVNTAIVAAPPMAVNAWGCVCRVLSLTVVQQRRWHVLRARMEAAKVPLHGGTTMMMSWSTCSSKAGCADHLRDRERNIASDGKAMRIIVLGLASLGTEPERDIPDFQARQAGSMFTLMRQCGVKCPAPAAALLAGCPGRGCADGHA